MPKQTEITQFTLKDSGVTVGIRKVSPLLVMELKKTIKEPEPPMQEVDYGDGKGKVLEPNLASPEYELAKKKFEEELQEKIKRLIFSRGVVINLEEDTERMVDLNELRDFWRTEYGDELPSTGNDKMDYISYIAISTGEDMNDLFQAIMSRSQANQGDISSAQKSF